MPWRLGLSLGELNYNVPQTSGFCGKEQKRTKDGRGKTGVSIPPLALCHPPIHPPMFTSLCSLLNVDSNPCHVKLSQVLPMTLSVLVGVGRKL